MQGFPATFTRRLQSWYAENQRQLPWRPPKTHTQKIHPNPYHVLLSEAMLQQTQVATVIPYFHRFLEKFPTLDALAAANEQEVLRQWQGLGYYSRARNLQKTAQQIQQKFQGQVPTSVEDLLTLPGIGRYTAGAIASIAYGQRAPILDGNVIRVLTRLDAIQDDPRNPEIKELLWTRAADLLPQKDLSNFNSALMELGALICTPKNPKCLLCPVNQHCEAYAKNLQEKIPPPKPQKTLPTEKRWTFVLKHKNKYLVEQRPGTGRWANMWQFPTHPASATTTPLKFLQSQIQPKATNLKLLTQIRHTLTHRQYEFEAFQADAPTQSRPHSNQHWLTLREIDGYPLPRPHLKIVQLLQAAGGSHAAE